jgi:hypothetical protein
MYGYSAGSGGFARLLVSLGALAAVGIPVALILTHGGTVNFALLPYAIPAAAVAIAVLVTIGNALFGPPAAVPQRRWRTSPANGIVIGLAGLTAAVFLTAAPAREAHDYATDPTCAAAFVLEPGTPGACRLAQARIVEADSSGSRSTSYYVVLRFQDGSSQRVTLAKEARGNVWRGARDGGDREATVQYFRTSIVQVETRSGRAIASAMPAEVEKRWALLGICAGVLGLVSAAFAILTSGIF